MTKLEIIDKSAQDLQSLYYEKELWFDAHDEFNQMGMDNVVGNNGTYDLEYYLQNDIEKAKKELFRLYEFYTIIGWWAECQGYGSCAASRGFDITSPWGVMWTRCERATQAIRDICDTKGVCYKDWFIKAVAKARKLR